MPAIPVNTKPYYNTDPIANDIASEGLWDCAMEKMPDGKFITRKRPGLGIMLDTQAGSYGQGIYWCDRMNCAFAVANGKLFRIVDNGTRAVLLGTTLNATNHVQFAEGQDLSSNPIIYIADGAQLHYTTGLNCVTLPTTGDSSGAPTAVDSVVWFENRFVCQETGTGFFYATGVNPGSGEFDNLYWNSTFNPFAAEAKGDNILKLLSVGQELYVWGAEGMEVWQDDGTSPFINIPQAFNELGLLALDSVVSINGITFALVNYAGRRDVVMLNGRQMNALGNDILKVINEYATVSDAVGTYVTAQGMEFYLLDFPTEGQTWAYDIKNGYWAKWGNWNINQAQYERFAGWHSCYCRAWGKTLLQSRSDGRIYIVDRSLFTDAGNTIRAARRTGWIDYDVYFRRKRSDQLFVKMKTQQQDGLPVMRMRWRNDGRPEWSNSVDLPMFQAGQYDFLSKLNRMGMYRARQYEFILSDDADMALCEVQEDYTEMRN